MILALRLMEPSAGVDQYLLLELLLLVLSEIPPGRIISPYQQAWCLG